MEDSFMEIDKITRMVRELPERDARLLLGHMLKRIHFLNEQLYSEKRFIKDMKSVYKAVLDNTDPQRDTIEGPIKLIHILFGDSAAGSFRQALKEMGAEYNDEKIICVREMFSIGPTWKFNQKLGNQARYKWLQNNLSDEDGAFAEYKENLYRAVNQIMSIKEDIPIYLWAAENAEEQTGLRFAGDLLKKKNNDIFVMNTTKGFNELFSKGKQKYSISNTGEIGPEKLQVIYEQREDQSPLTQQERKHYEKEWHSLTENKETLRIWKNGTVEGVPEDYFDDLIINRAKKLHGKRKKNEFFKSLRLIGDVLGHIYLDQYISDTFINYRLKKMIENGIFEMEGSLEGMRLYSVRLKQ